MQILIIEDEAETAAHLQRLIQQYALDGLALRGPLRSVREAIEYLHNQPTPDLIFLDIQLADGLSFEIFDEVDLHTPIVFTTAYNQFLQRAFEVNSLDFLLKPIRYEHLARSLDKYQKLYRQQAPPKVDSHRLREILPWERTRYKSRFLVKRGKQLVVVPTDEIACILKEEVLLLFTRAGRRFPFPHSLEEAEQLLDPQHFFRINRQCIVHLKAISEIRQEGSQLMLSLDPARPKWLAVSQRNTPAFKSWLAGE